MSTIPVRNFRIEEATWAPAKAKAEKMGIPLTLVIKVALRDFVQNDQFIISEPEIVEMPAQFHQKADQIGQLAEKAIKKH